MKLTQYKDNNIDVVNNKECQHIYLSGIMKGKICRKKTNTNIDNIYLCNTHKQDLTSKKYINNLKYIVTDIETTGLDKMNDHIIEIAYKIIKNGKIILEYQSLIKTHKKINSFILNFTGITNDMLDTQGKDIRDVLNDFYEDSKDCIFVAHFSQFDFHFIYEKLKLFNNKILDIPQLCTCIMSRVLKKRLIIDIPDCKLSTLCTYYNITNFSAHRAMSDVNATIELFNEIISLQNIYIFNYLSNKLNKHIYK